MSATGYLFNNLPESPERDEVMGMVRIVAGWRANQCGRRPGEVHHYLCDVADGLGGDLSFSRLVLELRFRLLRGDMILDDVDTAEQTVTWCESGKPCKTMTFRILANRWSIVRKIKLSKESR